jgi:putative transposase
VEPSGHDRTLIHERARDAAHAAGRPEMAGRNAGELSGAAYLGPDTHAPSARALSGQRWWPDAGRSVACGTHGLSAVGGGRADVIPRQSTGAMEALWTTGQLQVPPSCEADGVRQVLVAAARQQGNIRLAERYPQGRGVMKYLARYVRGGPIKDPRLVSFDGQQVTFRYGNHRDLDAAGQPRRAELTLRVAEFLRRWSEHVPLPGVHMVRAWGLYASTPRLKLARCRAQLPEEDTPRERPPQAQAEPPHDHNHPWEHCPVCQRPMVVTQVLPRAGAPPRVESWAAAA